MNQRRKTSLIFGSLLLVIALLTTTLAIVLWQLSIPSTWKVNVERGLKFTDTSNIQQYSIDFLVDRYGQQQKTYRIHNIGNSDANVTMLMPSSTSAYLFETNFVNVTIPKGAYVEFWIRLTDYDMNADLTYSGSFAWQIVDSFPNGNEEPEPVLKVWFEPSTVAYLSDTSQYLQFVSETFNKAEYNLSESVTYQFTTKNINPDYNIDSFSYKIELFKSGIYQYEVFSGMKDCIPDLEPQQTITISHVFSAPSTNGTYALKLSYTGHNSEEIPEPPPPTYAYSVTTYNEKPQQYEILNIVVEGFKNPSETSRIKFDIHNLVTFYYSNVQWKIEIFKNAVLVQTVGSGTVNIIGMDTVTVGWVNFISPSEYGSYVIKISVYGGST